MLLALTSNRISPLDPDEIFKRAGPEACLFLATIHVQHASGHRGCGRKHGTRLILLLPPQRDQGRSRLSTGNGRSLTADRRTVIVDFLTGTSVDDIRVITAAPEPASLSLLTLAAAPLLLRRRRR